MGQITEKTIDIDSILKNKMGAKAKWVPRPLVAWLKRIAHQDQVNAFLWESRDKVGTPWLEACVDYLQMTLEVEGMENLPDPADGRLYTFVSSVNSRHKPLTKGFLLCRETPRGKHSLDLGEQCV